MGLWQKKDKRQDVSLFNNYSDLPVSTEGCDTLVIVVVHGFLGENGLENKQWFAFRLAFREAPRITRWKTALRIGTFLYMPWSEYQKQEMDDAWAAKKVILYIPAKGNPVYADDEVAWLLRRQEEGFFLYATRWVCFQADDMEGRYERNSLFLPHPDCLSNPLSAQDLDRYPYLHRVHQYLLRIHQLMDHKIPAYAYLTETVQMSFDRNDPVQKVYVLLKLCEYCIHLRAVKILSQLPDAKDHPGKTLSLPSFGTLSHIQAKNDKEIYDDRELAGSARMLETVIQKNRKHRIREKKVSYANVCEMVVRLRNHFMGHGILSEDEALYIAAPLASLTYKIVSHFVKEDPPAQSDLIPSPESGIHVPAVCVREKETYYFAGYYYEDERRYVDYLCFRQGYELRFSLDDLTKPVIMSVKTASCEPGLLIKPRKDYLTEGLTQKQKKELSRYEALQRGMTAVDVLSGNNPETRKRWREMYPALTVFPVEFGNIDYGDVHEFLLWMKCPVYFCMIDRYVWKNLVKGQISPEAYMLSEFMAMGRLLPTCRFEMAVIGMDPQSITHPYPWMTGVGIHAFKTEADFASWKAAFTINFFDVVMRYTAAKTNRNRKLPEHMLIGQAMQMYSERSEIYAGLLRRFAMPSMLMNVDNPWFAGLLKNAMDIREYEASIVSLMNFAEFASLSVFYWLWIKHLPDTGMTEGSWHDNTAEICSSILELAEKTEDERFGDLKNRRLKVSKRQKILQERCRKYFPVSLEGDEMDFEMTFVILRYLRNRTKGHGVVQPQTGADLWELIFIYVMALVRFLELYDFMFIMEDQKVWTHFKGDSYKYYRGDLFISEHGLPCPLWNEYKGYMSYMNYFEGQRILTERRHEDGI